jgi:A/G-specific adenine glycosylase
LDGNVIRVLSRIFALKTAWWITENKNKLQNLSDQIVLNGKSSLINQAMMELGATICTPQSPACFICPISKNCMSFKKQLTAQIPLKKPRKKSEIWIWQPILLKDKNKIAMLENDYAPFLKGQLIFPGNITTSRLKPKDYDLRHGITHHDIYIQIRKGLKSKISKKFSKELRWISISKLAQHNPSSLIKKVLQSDS